MTRIAPMGPSPWRRWNCARRRASRSVAAPSRDGHQPGLGLVVGTAAINPIPSPLIGITTLVCRKVERCTRHAGGGLEVWACLVDFEAVCSGVTRKRFYERHAGGILSTMMSGAETGFILDRQWFRLQGEMERTKRPALVALPYVVPLRDRPSGSRMCGQATVAGEAIIFDRLPG